MTLKFGDPEFEFKVQTMGYRQCKAIPQLFQKKVFNDLTGQLLYFITIETLRITHSHTYEDLFFRKIDANLYTKEHQCIRLAFDTCNNDSSLEQFEALALSAYQTFNCIPDPHNQP